MVSPVWSVFIILIFAQSALSLRCYRCEEQYTDDNERTAEDNSECFEDYSCDDNDLYADGVYEACYTTVKYSAYTGRLRIEKGCYGSYSTFGYDDCAIDIEELAVEYQCNTDYDMWRCRYCCTGDLCNESGVTMATYSALVILLGVATSLALFV